MSYNFKSMGRLIRTLRIRRKLSQEVLSGLAGISRSHLAMIESGTKNPTVATLWRIASSLDMPLSRLFELLETQNN